MDGSEGSTNQMGIPSVLAYRMQLAVPPVAPLYTAIRKSARSHMYRLRSSMAQGEYPPSVTVTASSHLDRIAS